MRWLTALGFLSLAVVLSLPAEVGEARPLPFARVSQPSNLSTFKCGFCIPHVSSGPSNVPVPCALYPFVFFLLRKTCSNDGPPANSINTEKLFARIIIIC